tara:strand:+ start:49 stop:657 length:609 start_codon:yes stop_codon:yes gene_type:complete
MAKGNRDIILRDRLQFDVAATTGNVNLVYGRVDLSDYVSIVRNEGLAIKEIRFQFRDPASSLPFPVWMNTEDPNGLSTLAVNEASIRVFATTTAYELAQDVGIASPNVICMMERINTTTITGTAPNASFSVGEYKENWYGTPDLHPEGYDVVTDLLIGVTANGLLNTRLEGTTQELDIMIIAEPKKITSKDLTQMLTQAQDL